MKLIMKNVPYSDEGEGGNDKSLIVFFFVTFKI